MTEERFREIMDDENIKTLFPDHADNALMNWLLLELPKLTQIH